jgi:hypothetical protein
VRGEGVDHGQEATGVLSLPGPLLNPSPPSPPPPASGRASPPHTPSHPLSLPLLSGGVLTVSQAAMHGPLAGRPRRAGHLVAHGTGTVAQVDLADGAQAADGVHSVQVAQAMDGVRGPSLEHGLPASGRAGGVPMPARLALGLVSILRNGDLIHC